MHVQDRRLCTNLHPCSPYSFALCRFTLALCPLSFLIPIFVSPRFLIPGPIIALPVVFVLLMSPAFGYLLSWLDVRYFLDASLFQVCVLAVFVDCKLDYVNAILCTQPPLELERLRSTAEYHAGNRTSPPKSLHPRIFKIIPYTGSCPTCKSLNSPVFLHIIF